jgi:enamine deaminase RidA (YjgF/YER057c/UK114 family)
VDFATQLERALEELLAAVRALGEDRRTILKVSAYLAVKDDFTIYRTTPSTQNPPKVAIIPPP